MCASPYPCDADAMAVADPGRPGFDIRMEPHSVEVPSRDMAETSAPVAPGKALYKVDLGNDIKGELVSGWLPDRPWTPGADYGTIGGKMGIRPGYVNYFGTIDPEIHRSEHYNLEGLRFRVAPGIYSVRLWMAEGFECVYRPGGRVFDVAIQGEVRLKAVDPFEKGGGIGGVRSVLLTGIDVKEGQLAVDFIDKKNSAALTAVEVFECEDGKQPEVLWEGQTLERHPLAKAPTAKVQRVLFIGNSHTFFWAMPESHAGAMNRTQKDVWIESYRYLHGGWGLNHFLGARHDAGRVLDVILAGRYDVVVVQDALGAYPEQGADGKATLRTWEAGMRNMQAVADAVRAAGSKLVIYQVDYPWVNEAGGEELESRFLAQAAANHALLIPSNLAQRATNDPQWNGPRPAGYLSIGADRIHYDIHRAYLNKCLFYIAWTGRTPEGTIPRTLVGFDMSVDNDMAGWIETFAWKFYSEYARKHDIPLGMMSATNSATPDGAQLPAYTATAGDPGYTLDGGESQHGEFRAIRSATMGRDIPALIFSPTGSEQVPLPVVYMLHGTTQLPPSEESLRKLNGEGSKTQELADMFRVRIVTPLTGLSYFMDSPLKPEYRFATFIGEELPKYMDANFATIPKREARFLAGFSMGGYGAVSLLCRYPDTFSVALARAGVLNLATTIDDLHWDGVFEPIVELLGDPFTQREEYHKNNCFTLINHIRERKDVHVVIQIGREDFLYKTNYAFHQRLKELGISHIYSEFPGGHGWNMNALRSLLSDLQYFAPTQFPPKR